MRHATTRTPLENPRGGRFIAIAVAALVVVAAGVAWALSTQVAYDEYAPVTVKQELPAAVTEDTWTTVQFKDTDSGATYRQAVKIAAGSTSACVKVMLGVYRSYEVSIASEQSSWRYENEKATYGNSTDDGGNDTWTATATTIDGAAATKLPATLKIGTVDNPVLDRTVTLTAKKTNDQWESDVASVVNTVTMPAQKTVTFDNQGHGNAVASQVVLADGTKTFTEPTAAQVGTSTGLTLEGWYTDAKCSTANKYDFTTLVTDSTPLTLYANWVPTTDDEQGLDSYWIGPASKYVAQGENSAAVANADNYVSATTNVLKSSAEIQADIQKLIDGDRETVNYYTTLMKEDKYHLYTVYKGSDATADEDKYLEARIIQVGAHQASSDSTDLDNSVLTFQATHTMPTALQVNSTAYNDGGWKDCDMRATINDMTQGTSYFNSKFLNALASTKKVSYDGGWPINDRMNTTYDKFWLLSIGEVTTQSWTHNAAYTQLAPDYGSEGVQYAWYADRTLNGDRTANPCMVLKTRAGNVATGEEGSTSYWRLRTAGYEDGSTAFHTITPEGAYGDDFLVTESHGFSPCFSFGRPAVTYDMQGHGDQVAQQLISDGKVDGYTAADITGYDANSLVFGGWYDNAACSGDAITDFSFTTSTTLYANWKPTDNLSKVYWISPGSKYLTQGKNVASASNAVASGGNYVSETTCVLKTADEIKADVAKIRRGDLATTAYYTKLMKADKYHLYTKVGTGTTANDYVEFRIINVGEHSAIGDSADGSTLQSDGSALTFQATHALTTSYQHKTTNSNEGGWGSSLIHTAMQAGGSIYTQFNTGFTDDIYSVKKFYRQGSTTTTDSTTGTSTTAVDNTVKYTTDKLWIMAYQEHVNTIVAGHRGCNVENEGNVYQFWSGIPLNNWTANQALISLQQTRAGANVTNSNNSMMWLRSPNAKQSNTSHYYCLYSSGGTGSGEFGGATGAASLMMGVAPCFTFGGNAYTVSFNSNGHGTQAATQTVLSGAKATAPTASEYGSAEGLKLEGWYTEASCQTANKVDFLTWTPTADTTLYANWVPDGDATKYWIGPSYKMTTGNTAATSLQDNANYSGADRNVKKSYAEIEADIKTMKKELAEGKTVSTADSTLKEYYDMMTSDAYHLYTKWNGTTADGKGATANNDYVEARIINVGEHDSDSSVLTFESVFELPAGQQMYAADTSSGGWGGSLLYQNVNSGTIYNSFNTAFTDDLFTVSKTTSKGGGSTDTETCDNKIFILSMSELTGSTNNAYTTVNEGSQYAYYNKIVPAPTIDFGKTANYAYGVTTRAGNYQTGYTWPWVWVRTPITAVASWTNYFAWKGNKAGNFNVVTAKSNTSGGVQPAFALGGYLVQFDSKGGSDVDEQLLRDEGKVEKPADPTRDGYMFKGWYKDSGCTAGQEFDFDNDTISSDTTLYAKWDSVADSYWLNYAGVDNPEEGVLKTKSDIQADLAALAAGTGADYERVLAEYTGYMNGTSDSLASEVHLYTKLKDGANTTTDADGNSIAANDYVEWRIVSLGEHAGDGTTITWQMAHVLPTAQQMNATDTNAGGYAGSALHTAVAEGGDVYNMFRDEFLADILKVDKTSNTGSKGTATTTTSDKLWIASAEEVYGTTATTSGAVNSDGASQYSYYADKGVTKGDATNECLAYRTRAGGLPDGQDTDYSDYHGGSEDEMYASWWLRSPSAYNEQTYTRVYNDGRLDHNLASVKRGVALTCAMEGVDYTISKSKMKAVLRALSDKPTALKFVTGESLQGISGLTNLAADGIQEDGYDKVGVFQSADTATLYIAPMEDDSTEPADNSYVLHAPQDCADFLNAGSGYTALESSLKTIDCANLDTSKTTDMRWFFCNNTGLTELNLGDYFDTGNATMMTSMFGTLSSIETIDLKDRFDTGNVTIMTSMFINCEKLKSITSLSQFSTGKVTNMDYMFNGCKALTELDVDSFDTSKVTTMQSMFSNCNALTSLDVTGFSTVSVTNMSYMFQNCKLLGSLDVRNFNTAKVAKMQYMFYGCSLLESLDVSTFDTSSVVNMDSMFMSCDALASLDLSNFVTSKVTSMSGMFANDYALAELDVSNFITGSVTSMSSMFQGCRALSELDLSSFNTSAVKNMAYLVQGCTTMESLDLSSFDTSAVTNMNYMFNNCTALQSVTLGSGFDFLTTGTSTYLPEPSSAYITGADGNWYDTTTSTGYTPANLATFHNALNETRTYVAIKLTNYYWLAAAGASDPSDSSGILKSQMYIDEDLEVLHGTKAKTSSGKDKAAVTAEWEGYMNGSTHLYTKWSGTDAGTGANQWVEFQIIQVGEHDGDGSAVTFMATHALPTAGQMNTTATSVNGWTGSAMYQTLNASGGYVMNGLSDLVSSGKVKAVSKKSPTGSAGSWVTDSTSNDKFWLLSYTELTGDFTKQYTASEGSQYTWLNGGTYTTASSTREGAAPASSGYSADWYLRSPYTSTGNGAFWFVRNGSVLYTYGPNLWRSIVPCFAM